MQKTLKEFKSFDFDVVTCKQIEQDGLNIGVIDGYLSTWDRDSDGDIILPTAFDDALEELRMKGDPLPMLLQHSVNQIIGAFPIEKITTDDRGLRVTGHVNLDVQKGRETYALGKQNVLNKMSIGMLVNQEDIEHLKSGDRVLQKVKPFEGSIVLFPANKNATGQWKAQKGATEFQDFPLADQEREWDGDAAEQRGRAFTNSEDEPSEDYKNLFFWYDEQDADEFGAYKLGFVDVIDGRLTAVPRGVFAAAAAVEGARGGVDIPSEDRAAVVRHINRYYEKMDLESPFEESDFNSKKQITVDDLRKNHGRVSLEKLLKATGVFSRGAASLVASRVSGTVFDKEPAEPQRKSEEINQIIQEASSQLDEYLLQKEIKNLSKQLELK